MIDYISECLRCRTTTYPANIGWTVETTTDTFVLCRQCFSDIRSAPVWQWKERKKIDKVDTNRESQQREN